MSEVETKDHAGVKHIGMIGYGSIGRDVVSLLSNCEGSYRFTVLLREGSPSIAVP